MNIKDLRRLRDDTQRRWAELHRLGDYDANTPYIKSTLWNLLHLIEHAIQMHPDLGKRARKTKKAP
jgi:hypothetical protein